jgi:hypothetical protein
VPQVAGHHMAATVAWSNTFEIQIGECGSPMRKPLTSNRLLTHNRGCIKSGTVHGSVPPQERVNAI